MGTSGLFTRLSLEDLKDQHREWLVTACEGSLDEATIEMYTQAIRTNMMALWDLGGRGIMGLSRTNKVLWVEFVVGKDLESLCEAIVLLLQREASGRRIEALPSRKGMVRVLERLGFKPVSTLMRLS